MTVQRNNVAPFKIADAAGSVRHVFVRDYETIAHIGVYRQEFDRTQRIRVNVDLTVIETGEDLEDKFENVVCYNRIVQGIETILAGGHIQLVETLAEKIADLSLLDQRVDAARVRVEKLEAVAGAASVGVEIERRRIS